MSEQEQQQEQQVKEEEAASPVMRSDVFIPRLRTNDPELTELNLSGCYVTSETILLIAECIPRNTYLTELDLSHNAFGALECTELLVALQMNRTVASVNLSHNENLDEMFGVKAKDLLENKSSTLQYFNVRNTGVPDDTCNDIEQLCTLNTFPANMKSVAFRAAKNDPQLFSLELTDDKSDVRVYNERSTRIIVDALKDNTTVRTLRLDFCCRSEHCSSILAELLASNEYITKLSLNHNYFSDATADILSSAILQNERTVLEDLEVEWNELTDDCAPYWLHLFEKNHVIRRFKFEHNRISSGVEAKIRSAVALNCEPPSLKQIMEALMVDDSSLTELNLRGSESTGRAAAKGYYTNLGATTLANALRSNTNVTKIDLSSNHIGPDGVAAIANLVRNNNTITYLDLSSNPIQDEGARHLVQALTENDAMSVCRLSGCGVSLETMERIGKMCHVNLQPLPLKEYLSMNTPPDVLDFSVRPSQPVGKLSMLTPDSLPYLATLLKHGPNVTEISLEDNRIGDGGAVVVAEIIKTAPKLKKLVLSNTGMTDHGIILITQAIRSNYSIQVVLTAANPSVSWKTLNLLEDMLTLNLYPPHIKDIVPSLKQNVQGIRVLDFAKSNFGPSVPPLGDDPLRILFDALTDNTEVDVITVSGQKVSNRGVGYLCDCLDKNKSVTKVNLSNNEISVDGANTIALMLQNNDTLTSLDLTGNRVGETGAGLIEEVIRDTNRAIVDIRVGKNQVSQQMIKRIDAYASFNTQPVEFRRQVLNKLSTIDVLQYHGAPECGYIDDQSCRVILNALEVEDGAAPTALDLSGNHIAREGVAVLAEVVAMRSSVTVLNLSDNRLDNDCVFGLIKAVEISPNLKHVYVDNNTAVTDKPLLHRLHVQAGLNRQTPEFRNHYDRLANQTKERTVPPLIALELPCVGMDKHGVELLCEMLGKRMEELRLVDLSGNAIDDHGVATLVRHLPLTLQALYLENNIFGEDGANAVREYTWRSDSILECSISARSQRPGAEDDEAAATEYDNALSSIETKVSANKTTAAQNSVVMSVGRSVQSTRRSISNATGKFYGHSGASGGREVATILTRPFDEEKQVDSFIMQEALAEMPRREPYFRGKYVSKS